MAAIARRSLFFAPLALLADTRQEILAVIAAMSTDLSNSNPSGFMKAWDKNMPDYGIVRRQVIGLIDYAEISSSVEIQNLKADGDRQIATLDWYLVLRNRGESTMVTNKRDLLSVSFRPEGKSWKITSIQPLDFFTQEK